MRTLLCRTASIWALGLGLLVGCSGPGGDSGSGQPVSVMLSGAVQKGPFVLGSTINISPLDATLNPTGQVFSTQTTSDLGQFSVNFMAAGRVALEGSGFYYNEVTGKLSSAQLTLHAIYDIGSGGTESAYINLVTHLSLLRVKQLIGAGMTTATATTQAESELRAALGIGPASFTVTQPGTGLNILGGDSDASAYLFALSSVVAQAAVDKAAASSASIDATLQELLNTTAQDLSDDGQIQAALHQSYLDAQRHVDVDATMAALAARIAQIGSSAAVPDLNRVIDSDGDGVVNGMDNCPYAANANQAPVPDGLCRFEVKSFPGPNASGGLSLAPVDLMGNKTYSVFASSAASPQSYFLLKNDGTGALGSATAVTLAAPSGASGNNNCCGLTIQDMNNDQKDDILRIDSAGWMAVFPGDGAGGFGAPQAVNKLPPLTADMIGGQPFTWLDRYCVGDYNKDGLMDILGSFMSSTLVLVTQGAGGTWSAPSSVKSLTTLLSAMAVADFDKDTKLDVVYLDGYIQGSHLYFGKGDGTGGFTFTNPTSVPGQAGSSSIAVGDFNSDSNLDLLVLVAPVNGKQMTPSLYFVAGDGLGGFATPVQTAIPYTASIAGDFLGTAQPSVLASPQSGSLQLWTFRGGQFMAGPERPFVPFGASFARDMDKDGKLDIVGSVSGSTPGSNLLTVALSR